jgi:hypothetical protein
MQRLVGRDTKVDEARKRAESAESELGTTRQQLSVSQYLNHIHGEGPK